MSIYNQEVTGNHCWCFLLHMEYDNFRVTSKTNDKSLHSYIGAHRGPFSLREPLTSTISKKGGKWNSLNCSFPAGFWLELPQIYEEVTLHPQRKQSHGQFRGSPKSAGESYCKWGKTPIWTRNQSRQHFLTTITILQYFPECKEHSLSNGMHTTLATGLQSSRLAVVTWQWFI